MIATLFRTVAVAVLVAGHGVAAEAKVYGLVVGIDNYVSFRHLHGAVADARDVASALIDNGAEVTLLIDAAATRAKIESEWKRMTQAADRGDTFVFAYAGHGGQEPDQPPLDEEDGSDESFLLADFTPDKKSSGYKERIVDDEFYAWLQDASAKGVQVLLVLDSCHSGGLTRQLRSFRGGPSYGEIGEETIANARERAKNDPQSLTTIERRLDGVYVMSAVEEKKLAPEVIIDGVYRGALSYVVSRGLEGAADVNGDGKLSASELQAYVAPQVGQWAEGGQVPVFLPAQYQEAPLLPAGTRRSPLFVTSLLTPPKVAFKNEASLLAPKQLRGAAIVASTNGADLIVEMARDRNAFVVRNVARGVVADELPPGQLTDVVAKWRLIGLVKKVMAGRSIEFTLGGKQAAADDAEADMKPFHSGEQLSIASEGIPTGHYATVLAIAGDGSITVLDPAASVVRNPDSERPWQQGARFGFDTKVQPPYGADHVLMITSDKPLAEVFASRQLDAATLPQLLERALAGRDFRLGLASIYTAAQ